jgi:hypothetical protein
LSQLSERATILGQCRTTGRGSPVNAARAAVDDLVLGHQQTVGFEPVQCGIQGAWADFVPVTAQFLCQPRAVDLVGDGVMQDVQPHRGPLKFAQTHHLRPGLRNRYRIAILLGADSLATQQPDDSISRESNPLRLAAPHEKFD